MLKIKCAVKQEKITIEVKIYSCKVQPILNKFLDDYKKDVNMVFK